MSDLHKFEKHMDDIGLRIGMAYLEFKHALEEMEEKTKQLAALQEERKAYRDSTPVASQAHRTEVTSKLDKYDSDIKNLERQIISDKNNLVPKYKKWYTAIPPSDHHELWYDISGENAMCARHRNDIRFKSTDGTLEKTFKASDYIPKEGITWNY